MKSLIILTTFAVFAICKASHVQITRYESPIDIDIVNLNPFTKIGNKNYWIEDKQRLNWFDAVNFCRSKGGHLASLESEEEMQALAEYIQDHKLVHLYWIGANDLASENSFHWIDSGLPLKYTKWGYNQPDNWRGEHCVHLDNEMVWNDRNCKNSLHYICEGAKPKTIKVTLW